jgi:hypothetical protein
MKNINRTKKEQKNIREVEKVYIIQNLIFTVPDFILH